MSRLIKSSYFYPLEVIIDDREPMSVEKELLAKGNLLVQRKRLDVGDYIFDNDLLVERKTVVDFCGSIKDGRLFKQVSKLAKSKIPGILILEGKQKEFKETDFSVSAIQGILVSISLGFKIPILQSKGIKETVAIMLQGYKQLTKDRLQDQRVYPRKGNFKKGKDQSLKQKIHILEGFPGIGVDRAERLLDHFGSLKAAFDADFEKLLSVPGFGRISALKFIEILDD
ncbi:ERCC4 domain-containing protein [Aquiflexum lacus]|uniref:ERCC4 domain-containing protein n=1 Tax=Aquiflexum lacus TaxID=2483805 RepID=UPI0018963B5A|nr:ERCC4 domain-containing protein [Aquiflexum lacus]